MTFNRQQTDMPPQNSAVMMITQAMHTSASHMIPVKIRPSRSCCTARVEANRQVERMLSTMIPSSERRLRREYSALIIAIIIALIQEMILQASENQKEQEQTLQAYSRKEGKLGQSNSTIFDNQSRDSSKSRFSSTNKLTKSHLFKTIAQKPKPHLDSEIEQRNLQIQLLQSAIDTFSRELASETHRMGHTFLKYAMVGQLSLSKLASRQK